MATVVGHVTHDVDYAFTNQAGEEKTVTAGVWSVLSCPSGHVIAGNVKTGTDVGPCPECGL